METQLTNIENEIVKLGHSEEFETLKEIHEEFLLLNGRMFVHTMEMMEKVLNTKKDETVVETKKTSSGAGHIELVYERPSVPNTIGNPSLLRRITGDTFRVEGGGTERKSFE